MRARKERGQILVLVLVVMVFGVLVVTPLLAYVDISLRLYHSTHHRTAAYYAADAGVERVIGDLYQRENILAPGYNVTSNEPIEGYTFNATADLPEGEAPPPPETEVYLDPGGCFGMRPIVADGEWNYSIVLPAGQSLKVNWAAYVRDEAGTEHCQGEIQLWKDDTPITSSLYSGDQEDGDEGRAVAITWDIPGWFITTAGVYKIIFKNNSSVTNIGDTSADVYAKCFAGQGDDDHTFTASIIGAANCSKFIDAGNNNEITILAFNEDGNYGGKVVNANTIFSDYVEVKITTNTSENTYTFADITEGSGPHYSYDGKLTKGAYGLITEMWPAGGVTELDDAGYDAIEAFEGVRHMVPPAPLTENTCLWHEFHINETPAEVTRIDVRWEGYQARAAEYRKQDLDTDELYLLAWNYTGNKYDILDNRMQDAGYTWVKVYQGACKDYIITSTAYAEDDTLLTNPIVTIKAYVRQVPGPSLWWEEQRIEILSWNISR